MHQAKSGLPVATDHLFSGLAPLPDAPGTGLVP
jgi:hypothetical protein